MIIMKITVIKSSPNTHGSSNLLANEFIRGAQESGHTVTEIDAAKADILPCTGCIACGYNGPCLQDDDMETIKAAILGSDMIVS